MYPRPIPPPLFNECEVEDCPAKNGEVCEYCLDEIEDLEDTLDGEEGGSNEDGEESKDS
jgi:hypothetical protein